MKISHLYVHLLILSNNKIALVHALLYSQLSFIFMGFVCRVMTPNEPLVHPRVLDQVPSGR